MNLRTAKRIVDAAGKLMPNEAHGHQFIRWIVYDATDRDIERIQTYIRRRGAYKMDAVLGCGAMAMKARRMAGEARVFRGQQFEWTRYPNAGQHD